MTAPINIENIFPSFELLTANNNPDSNTEADEAGVLDATQAVATATLANGEVTDATVNDAGSFFTTNPIVTVDAPDGGEVAQVNSTGTLTINGTPANGKTVTIDSTAITFGDMTAVSAVDIRTDILGSSAVSAVPSSTEISIDNTYAANDIVATGAVQTLDFANITATSGAYSTSLSGAAVTISGGSGSGLSLTVDTDGSGNITAVDIVDPGSDYEVNDTITITAGGAIGGTSPANDITIDVSTVSATAFSLSIKDFNDNSVVFTAGVDFDPNGLNRAAIITALQSAIDGDSAFSASVVTGGVKVEHVVPASSNPTDGDGKTVTKSNDSNNRFTVATFANAVDPVDAGNANDDLAATIAAFIRANVSDFSAETNGAEITVSYTGSNGTDPASPIGDTKTISTNAAVISVSGANLTGGAVEKRTAVVTAALYADTDATHRGTIETLNVVDGGSGYTDTPDITIPLPNGNTIEKIGKLGADMVSGGGTFNYAKDYVAIALEDFNINSAAGVLANPLSSTESAEGSGDYRKLIYHILRKTFDFLNAQESVATIDVSAAGTGYAITDTVSITGGGGSGATASLAVDSTTGAITGVNVDNVGAGYTTIPTVIITTSTGSGGLLSVNLTENTPEKFSLQKGFLSENSVSNEVTRDYTTSFTFDESGLEMAPES